jgi:ATP-dependent Lon protease
LAAQRGGLTTVLIPKDNEKDLVDIPDNVKSSLEIIPVAMVDEALSAALVREPMPLAMAGMADISAESGTAVPDSGENSSDIVAH